MEILTTTHPGNTIRGLMHPIRANKRFDMLDIAGNGVMVLATWMNISIENGRFLLEHLKEKESSVDIPQRIR